MLPPFLHLPGNKASTNIAHGLQAAALFWQQRSPNKFTLAVLPADFPAVPLCWQPLYLCLLPCDSHRRLLFLHQRVNWGSAPYGSWLRELLRSLVNSGVAVGIGEIGEILCLSLCVSILLYMCNDRLHSTYLGRNWLRLINWCPVVQYISSDWSHRIRWDSIQEWSRFQLTSWQRRAPSLVRAVSVAWSFCSPISSRTLFAPLRT